ncbi:peptidylprolyl isomerase [Paenibacillus sp. IB182496]|uniref:Peptidylprolyl isomerase n=1 Tax=Paenibacillus sabuli TaxID=2772509 RepID=A0A927BWS6_9BACL|nr:peptidylprolyl isomerase [Paenibacillus sabuli]MBD2848308.1 peptidylprolyl isomerase [Paenibacillus sabuli]
MMMLASAVLAMTLLAGCGSNDNAASDDPGQVVATYKDGGEVGETEFNHYISLVEITDPQKAMYLSIPQFKEQELQMYVLYKYYAGVASDEQKESAKENAASFKTEMQNAMDEDDQLKEMLDGKLTVNQAEDVVELVSAGGMVLQEKSAELEAQITDEERKAIFDENPSDYNTVTVRHILVGTTDPQTGEELRTDEEALARAEEVKQKLEDGGDWQALAEEYSDDEGSKANGGLYESQQAGGWVAEFKEAANTQEIGVIGDPVLTEFGYHVMLVEAREEASFDSLSEEVKTQLTNTVLNTKMNEFLEGEQESLNIETNLPEEEAPAAGEDEAGNGANSAENGTEGGAADNADGNAEANTTE